MTTKSTSETTVLVLGAGFTKAFVPAAPLLVDVFDLTLIRNQFERFPHALRLLSAEVRRAREGRVNLERLMTRLDSLMPYDYEYGAGPELRMLLAALKKDFIKRLDHAKAGTFYRTELDALASRVVEHGVCCMTFNYDDLLDEALWRAKKAISEASPPYWHPDGGYGFFCKPAETCVQTHDLFMDATSMLLLKLHGSTNWRIKRGYASPYGVDAIVHHSDWLPIPGNVPSNDAIDDHLESDPFIVPPVLVKADLVAQPILRLIWSIAFRTLLRAQRVVFVGYSFPETDMAARFLFTEALEHLGVAQVSVVNYAEDDAQASRIRDGYRAVFPALRDDQFDFRGAREWARTFLSAPKPAPPS